MTTNKCNAQCKVCFAQDTLKPEEMNMDDIKYIISKAGKNKKIMFFGLEPTVRNDLPEMIKLVKDSGNIPTLFTNGLKLADSEYTKRLKTAGLKEVFLSFNGFQHTYQKLESENSYNLKTKALQNLKNNKLFTFLAFVLMDNINENEIEKMIPFLITNNDFIKGLFLVPLSPFGRLEIPQKRYFTYSDIIKKIVESKNTTCKEGYFFEFEKLKINLHKFLIKFRKNISTGSQIITVPFKIEDKLIKEVIDLKTLKKINSALENGNIWNLLKYTYFTMDFLRFFLNSTKFYYKNLDKNLIYISLYQITTDLNYLPFWTHSIGIIKQKDNMNQNKFIFNCI
ncbi:MAG: radical SAM protein [Candidatus Saelkia tenebricola]|nr:radical SAM protein [Candidatus Saelkia tenebricola]